MSKELISDLLEVFPDPGAVVPLIELKFRFGGKHSMDILEATLKDLEDQKILLKYEFNGSVQFKSLKDIMAKPKSTETAIGGNDQLSVLANIVMAMGKHLDNSDINQLIDDYKEKFI